MYFGYGNENKYYELKKNPRLYKTTQLRNVPYIPSTFGWMRKRKEKTNIYLIVISDMHFPIEWGFKKNSSFYLTKF